MELLIETDNNERSACNNMDLFFELVIHRNLKTPVYRQGGNKNRLRLVCDSGIDDQDQIGRLAAELGNKFPCVRNIWLIKKKPSKLFNLLFWGEWRVILFSRDKAFRNSKVVK